MTQSFALPAAPAQRIVRSRLLAGVPGVRHGVSARIDGMGRADGNVAYSAPRDQADAWTMRWAWCAALELDAEAIVTGGQIHGADTLIVDGTQSGLGARPGSGRVGIGDALLTREPGPVLLTLHADCLPILLADPDLPAVASVHAGWRGTVADVAGAAVRSMTRHFGSDPGRLLAFLGPSICRSCYEVGPDVAEAWRLTTNAAGRGAIDAHSNSWRFDLPMANRLLLEREGVAPANIDESTICTRCGGGEWFSHRGQGPLTGRFGAFISIADVSR